MESDLGSRFVFGCDGHINMREDHQIIYVSGHNVIVYSTEDKS